ncbi:MAG: hypothetical protein WDN26_14060 [Chitinophagaceae bacterium]
MKRVVTYLLIISIFCNGNCRKNKIESNGLPPATQEGKNTLGFLLNGETWEPKGSNGTANLSIDFDPGFNNGILGIAAYRIITSNNREYFGIGIKENLNTYNAPATFSLSNSGLFRLRFENNGCSYFSTDADTNVSGSLTLTKLDRTNHIISGTFNASVSKTGCETINITEGRFDMKY